MFVRSVLGFVVFLALSLISAPIHAETEKLWTADQQFEAVWPILLEAHKIHKRLRVPVDNLNEAYAEASKLKLRLEVTTDKSKRRWIKSYLEEQQSMIAANKSIEKELRDSLVELYASTAISVNQTLTKRNSKRHPVTSDQIERWTRLATNQGKFGLSDGAYLESHGSVQHR